MNYLFLLGRILYGGFFLMNGIRHLTSVEQLAQYAASKGVPLPELAVVVTGLLLLAGGLSVLLGVWPTWGVLCLVVFLVPVTFIMHAYWADADAQMRMLDQVQFYKNMALLGAAIMLLEVPRPWRLSLKR
jgi:putative oxidoreductase